MREKMPSKEGIFCIRFPFVRLDASQKEAASWELQARLIVQKNVGSRTISVHF
jgi:hypothetical protein